MSDIVIDIEHLSKEYRLGVIGHGTLYRDLQSWWARLRGREDPNSLIGHSGRTGNEKPADRFLALDDVSFQVRRGETVGLIGSNGAGKSTLLKILSRITVPSAGRIVYQDRIASLLEVGTGFHAEMTGRQNIFLNGAILGMHRSEILRKFDEIVEFSGIEQFLDTPVKRYSSGMYVRLAFAVAAHLDAEILLVDEVLAVGDVEFQKKCLGKMRDVTTKEGRTVLFVSHNMEAVRRLCRKAILLERGKSVFESDDVPEAIERYYSSRPSVDVFRWNNAGSRFSSPFFTPRNVRLTDPSGATLSMPIRPGDDVFVRIDGTIEEPTSELGVGYVLFSEDGTPLYSTCQHDTFTEETFTPPPAGIVEFSSALPTGLLHHGTYHLALWVHRYRIAELVPPSADGAALAFSVEGVPGNSPYWNERRPGYFAPVIPWAVLRRSAASQGDREFS